MPVEKGVPKKLPKEEKAQPVSEQQLNDLRLQLRAMEQEIAQYAMEAANLRLQIRVLTARLNATSDVE